MGAGAARHSSALRGTVPCRVMTHHNKIFDFTASTATNGIMCSRNKERHLRKACNHGSISVSFKTIFPEKKDIFFKIQYLLSRFEAAWMLFYPGRY